MNKLLKKSKILLVGTALLGLVSCQRTESTQTEVIWWNNYQVPENPDDEKNKTSSTYKEYYFATNVIKNFEAKHTDIKINMVYKGSYSVIASEVKNALSTGGTPNIASSYGDPVAGYYNAGATLAMDSLMNDKDRGFGKDAIGTLNEKGELTETFEDDPDTTLDDMNQAYLKAEKGMYGFADNKFLSLPYSKSTEVFVINKSVFDLEGAGKAGIDNYKEDEKADKDLKYTGYKAPVAVSSKKKYSIPTNWTELITTARQMKADFPEAFAKQKDAQGNFIAVPFVWDSAQNMIISLLENMGIGYTDGSKTNVADQMVFYKQKDQVAKLLKQLKEWNDEGLIATQDQLRITNEAKGYHEYSSNLFAKGTIFMTISSTAGARYYSNDGYTASFNKMPTIDNSIYSEDENNQFTQTSNKTDFKVISQGPSLTFFDKGERSNNAAWEFYKYLTNTENSATLATKTSYFPIRTSSYNTSAVKELLTAADKDIKDDTKKADKNNAYSGDVLKLNQEYTKNDNYFISDVFDKSNDTRTAIGKMIDYVFNTKATAENTVDQIVSKAIEDAWTAVSK